MSKLKSFYTALKENNFYQSTSITNTKCRIIHRRFQKIFILTSSLTQKSINFNLGIESRGLQIKFFEGLAT